MRQKIVVGMSGGVDSSVAAALLKEEGYEVIGVRLKVLPDVDILKNEEDCCLSSHEDDAKKVCEMLDIEYHVLDFNELFEEKVIRYFIDEYVSGNTPNPCIACNKHIKFDGLLKKAAGLGAEYIATGHYAKIEYDRMANRYLLKRSMDHKKDQTYVLYNMTQYQLAHTLMPLGGYTKNKVREIADRLGLHTAGKPDSEEICFIPDNDYGKFIEDRTACSISDGFFKDINGNILGRHKGITHYTIGQRKGLGIAFGKPMFVVDIIPNENTIVLGEAEDVFSHSLTASKLNFIAFDKPEGTVEVTGKIRYTAKESPALMTVEGEDFVRVEFESPQRAVTPGQSIVFYKNDIVIGGGIIKRNLHHMGF